MKRYKWHEMTEQQKEMHRERRRRWRARKRGIDVPIRVPGPPKGFKPGQEYSHKGFDRFGELLALSADDNLSLPWQSYPCIEWDFTATTGGYGVFTHEGVCFYVHRAALESIMGSLPAGAFACHHCDNPRCMRPTHLFKGDAVENIKDRDNKGRAARRPGESNGFCRFRESDILEMRKLYAEGMRNSKIAERFKVTSSYMSLVLKKKIWRHI